MLAVASSVMPLKLQYIGQPVVRKAAMNREGGTSACVCSHLNLAPFYTLSVSAVGSAQPPGFQAGSPAWFDTDVRHHMELHGELCRCKGRQRKASIVRIQQQSRRTNHQTFKYCLCRDDFVLTFL